MATEKDLREEFESGRETGFEEGLEQRYNHDFIEKVIDAYLLTKKECQSKDYIERHDFISMVIDKTKRI